MRAGQWRVDARGHGRALSLADALVAAAAEATDAVILTRNVRDFSLTPVRVESMSLGQRLEPRREVAQLRRRRDDRIAAQVGRRARRPSCTTSIT